VIWTRFLCAGLLSLTLALVRWLPGEADWIGRVGPEAYDGVLGTLASGRIILASLVAYFCGEFSNAYIMARMKVLTQGRWLWTGAIASTLVGEGVDTLLFVLFAFYGTIAPGVVGNIILSNYLFKCSMEALVTTLTYRVVNFLEAAEGEDYYDYATDFNPFRIWGVRTGHE